MKRASLVVLLFILHVAHLACQTDKTDPSLDYLMTLQRAMLHHTINTVERRTQFCADLQQLLSHMKPSSDLATRVTGINCDNLLAETASSPYESPQFVWFRRRIEPKILSAIDALGDKLPNRPIIGTLPIPILNAKTILPPGGTSAVIVLNDDVFQFPYDIARAVIQAIGFEKASNGLMMTSVDPRKIAAGLASHPDAVRGVEWTTLSYLHLVSGPPNDPNLLLDTPLGIVTNLLFLEGLTDAIETFIMSHEYAHIILGHSARVTSALNVAYANGERVRVTEAAYSWRQEFEADAYGFLILDEVLKEKANLASGNYFKDPLYPLYLYAPRFFFTMMALVEDAKSYTETGAAAPRPSKEDIRIAKKAISAMFSTPDPPVKRASKGATMATHPPFIFRAAQAKIIEQKALSLFLEKADLEPGTESVYRLSAAFDGAIEALFATATPEFKKRHENNGGDPDGLPPAVGVQRKASSGRELSDLTPATVRQDLKARGLSPASTPGPLRDALVEYDFVTVSGQNLNPDKDEVLKAIKDLNLGFRQTALQSHVTVHTKEPGARIFYRLIGGGDSVQFNQLTNHAEDDVPIGLYFVWAERDGHPSSAKTAWFRIIQARTTVDLDEGKP